MDSRNVAIVFLVLGLVCAPAPLYLGEAGGAGEPPRTPYVYAAEPVDPSDPNDTDAIIDSYGGDVLLSVHEVSSQHSPDTYRAPTKTRRLLMFAMQNDHATTEDPAVQADLEQIERDYRYVHDATDDSERYHEIFVRSNGTVVQMLNATEGDVLDATLQRTVVTYANLSPRERTTFSRIREASANGSETAGYRPYQGRPLLDRLPTLVVYDGQLYDVHPVDRVDDADTGGARLPVSPTAIAVFGGVLLTLGFALLFGTDDDGDD